MDPAASAREVHVAEADAREAASAEVASAAEAGSDTNDTLQSFPQNNRQNKAFRYDKTVIVAVIRLFSLHLHS